MQGRASQGQGGICRRPRETGRTARPRGRSACGAAIRRRTLSGGVAVRQCASSAPLHQGRHRRPAPADRYRQAETRPRGSAARSVASSRRARSRRFTGARRLFPYLVADLPAHFVRFSNQPYTRQPFRQERAIPGRIASNPRNDRASSASRMPEGHVNACGLSRRLLPILVPPDGALRPEHSCGG